MRKRKRSSLALVYVLVLTLFGMLAAYTFKNHTYLTSAQEIVSQTMRSLRSSNQQLDATEIEEGKMTEKQKKHSKLFKNRGYEYATAGKKKLTILAQETGRDVEIYRFIGDVIMPESFSIDNYFRDLTCEADAVIIGDVKGKASQLTEDGTFVFSEYQFIVSQVIKNNRLEAIQPSGEITVVRSSGSVKLKNKNKKITTNDEIELPLKKNQSYILFLKFNLETQSYSSLGNALTDASFQINDGLVSQVSKQPFPFGQKKSLDLNYFLTKTQRVVGDDCSSNN